MSMLEPLFHPITRIKGVGPEIAKSAKRIIRLGRGSESINQDVLPNIRDFILHIPMRYEDRRNLTPIAELKTSGIATVKAKVVEHIPPKVRKGRYGRPLPYKIWLEDDAGSAMQLTFFHARHDYLAKLMPVGAERIISGRVNFIDGIANMAHPDICCRLIARGKHAALFPFIRPRKALAANSSLNLCR